MKLLILLILLTLSVNVFACSKHLLEFKQEKKVLLTTDDFQIESLKNGSGKWTITVKFEKSSAKKLEVITNSLKGKTIELFFDKKLMSKITVADNLKLVENRLTLATNFYDKAATELQSECQHN